MYKVFIALGLFSVIGLALGGFWYVNSMSEHQEPGSGTALPREQYVVGLFNYNPLLSVALFEFKKSLDRQAEVKNIHIEYREVKSTGETASMARAVDTLSKEHPDIIITGQASLPLIKQKIPMVPIIAILATNLRAAEAALNEPGNQAVFIDSGANTVVGDRLLYALKLIPAWKTILVLRGPDEGDFANPGAIDHLREIARGMGIVLVEKQFTTREEFNKFFLTYDFSGIDALFRYPDPFITSNLDILFAMSRQPRVNKPIIVRNRTELEMGGLLAYGTGVENLATHAADIAYKILTKKISPRDMPIERPYHFELGVNTSIARSFGIVIPDAFLQQCDYIVE